MTPDLPVLIQGGMGVAVSNWRLARAVSQLGHLGTVSGVAVDSVLVRRLQLGDEGGHMRRALGAFPVPEVGQWIVDKYYVPGGKHGERLTQTSMKRDKPSRHTEDLMVAAGFVEVWLAKEGHDGLVGVNHLEKVQATTLPLLYGAMLAGADYVVIGAGIPKTIPAVLDKLAAGEPVELRIDVKGATAEDNFRTRFDPTEMMRGELPALNRPQFLGIVSSHVLATMLATKIEVPVDGFIIEAPTAGGHNAPPRGKLRLDEAGEPIYGERDVPDLDVIRDLGLPFWLAGGWATPERIHEALDLGAAGVQVGTAFAYTDESGFESEIKRRVIELSRQSKVHVFTDPVASPSGFPFKVVTLEGTLSEEAVYENRRRVCELGYLRNAYRRDDGKMGWRCAAEPVDVYIGKGGDEKDTVGRKCLCSALLANVGLPQVPREGGVEPTLITSGDDVAEVTRFLPEGADSFTAADVVRYLLPEG